MTKEFYKIHGYTWQNNSDALFLRAWHLLFSEAKKSLGNIKNVKLLDAGCGNGDFYPYVLESSYRGIDISEDNVDRANCKFPNGVFTIGDITKTEFDDNSFDALISVEVIEHLTIDQLTDFLKEIVRITKKGSRVVITTPNLYYLWGVIPWSFAPIRKRLTMRKLIKGILHGYVNENYNLPVHHYRFRPGFLRKIIGNYLTIRSIKSTYWYNNRAIHGIVPSFQMKILNFSNVVKFKPLLLGQQLVIECENNK